MPEITERQRRGVVALEDSDLPTYVMDGVELHTVRDWSEIFWKNGLYREEEPELRKPDGFSISFSPKFLHLGCGLDVNSRSAQLSLFALPLVGIDLEFFYPWSNWLRGPFIRLDILGLQLEYDGLRADEPLYL